MRHVAPLLALCLVGCPTIAPLRPDAGGRVDGGPVDPFHDPLSRPATPTVSAAAFTPASECAGCHEDHFREWRTSMHAYAMVDPVFRALVAVRQADFAGTQDQFCVQCHSAIGVRSGAIVDGFSFDALPPIVLEGVTCDACHRVSDLVRAHDSGHVLDPGGPVRGPITDPIEAAAHEARPSPLHATSEFCAGCHDIHEVSGLALERPYAEWLASPAAEEGRPCQSCHMPSYRGRLSADAPERTLHRHRWVGVDLPLVEGFVDAEERAALDAEVEALLAGAAGLTLELPSEVRPAAQLDVVVHVENRVDGHALPTGSTFIRQMWLELAVRDASGALLYETGTLDANGDLRDHWSALDAYGDPDLITFGSGFVDARGSPELFSWRATEHFSRSLPPLFERTFTLFVPVPLDAVGPLEVQARLRFRSHPPHLLRALGLDGLVDQLVTRDMAATAGTVALAP